MPLNNQKKSEFKTIGHGLKPIVTIAGNGLSAAVVAEIQRALNDHELIKIKLVIDDRELRKSTVTELCQKCRAECVQTIGKMALIFKEAKEPNIKLSNIRG